MSDEHTDGALSEERRKEVFMVLVNAQDQEMSVAESRELTARRFDLTNQDILRIEREGLDKRWPPL